MQFAHDTHNTILVRSHNTFGGFTVRRSTLVAYSKCISKEESESICDPLNEIWTNIYVTSTSIIQSNVVLTNEIIVVNHVTPTLLLYLYQPYLPTYVCMYVCMYENESVNLLMHAPTSESDVGICSAPKYPLFDC